MRTPFGAFIFVAILLLVDLYAFQAFRAVSINSSSRTKTIINIIYWTVTVLAIATFLTLAFSRMDFMPKPVRNTLFAIIIGLFLAKLTMVFFVLIDDIRRLFQWIILKIMYSAKNVDTAETEGITRSAFLSWFSLAAGTTLFGSLLYGFSNKYKYHINKVQLAFDNLPAGFKGLKIVQISDVHSGSFTDARAVELGVEKILREKPDLILFTGDLVNDMAIEMDDYHQIFGRLKAPLGVYSTLGNHDYGDYVRWPQDGLTKEQNLENLKAVHANMGWRLLMNEHVPLERNGDKIALLGIENWSAKGRFPKHGRLDLAHKDTHTYPFKILMSHDPSHWEAQVQPHYSDIDLMLSGHTHGMQFGIEVPGFKWSPVQYMYKQWAGLYENEKQKLYVNRGFGFIGYPGRVGILPEITVIELV
ncbi:MAG TPA: metallophosphoesterase [Ferruginibacter sp.]|nr:metallophosphoesterase [Ferruginibacter sp.]HPH92200.1 metallophosphoesterase [Ferruginibacter sp.]